VPEQRQLRGRLKEDIKDIKKLLGELWPESERAATTKESRSAR